MIVQDRVAMGLLAQGIEPSWWWNPNNPEAVKPLPEPVTNWLVGFDDSLRLTFNPKKQVWQLWQMIDSNRATSERSYAQWATGWRKLADLVDFSGTPIGLPSVGVLEEIMAKIMVKRYGGTQKFCNTIEAINEKRYNDFHKDRADVRKKFSQEYARHMRPSIGYGQSNGSKQSTFDTGRG